MPQTGDICRETGVYQCDSCAMTLNVTAGRRFPPCGVERLRVVKWTLSESAAERGDSLGPIASFRYREVPGEALTATISRAAPRPRVRERLSTRRHAPPAET
jgi:hypothetical protein